MQESEKYTGELIARVTAFDADDLDRTFTDIVRAQTLVARVRLGIILGFLTVIAIVASFLARHLRAEEKRRDELMAHASRELEALSAPSSERTEPVDLAQLARDCGNVLELANAGRPVELSVDGEMLADIELGLARLLIEALLKHAWKVSADANSVRVEVGSASAAGQACYFVRNKGGCIDDGAAKNLFTSHAGFGSLRADRAELGTAQRVIRRCGGRIWAEGGPEGATIRFTLPTPQNRSS
jgi:signal transduction histidine kinase